MDQWCCGLFYMIEPTIKECQKTKKTNRQFMHKSFFLASLNIFLIVTIFFLGLSVFFSIKIHYLRVMKMNFELKRLFLFAVITLGVLLLTSSLAIAIGVLVSLFVADYFLGVWENNRIKKSENDDGKSE